jgi:hypothetical protein
MSVTIKGTTLTCPEHKRYMAAFPPKADAHCPNFCAVCWDLFEMQELEANIERDLDSLRQAKDRFTKENG